MHNFSYHRILRTLLRRGFGGQAFLLALCCTPLLLSAQTKIKLTDFATGFSSPVDIAHCGDSRLFVVEQGGKIWILDSLGKKSAEPFLDITNIVQFNGEQGLLGLAFHPKYQQNGYFFVNYIKESGNFRDTRIARYSRSATDPQKADPTSEAVLFDVVQPYANHNGGGLKFGPDSMLYIALGDGGSGGDPQGNGQKTSTLLGKISRVDVNGTALGNYSVPADNPFVGNSAYRPEIWSLGWRNPWRFSFDRLTGDMWVGDVGQNKREEVDFEPKNTPGLNYGWRCYEGTQTYNTAGCQGAANYVKPVFEYVNPALGQSITGGFRYRGSQYPGLSGLYLVADYVSGRWWSVQSNADGTFTGKEIAKLSGYEYSSFGEDAKGELYVTGHSSGKIQRVTELCGGFQVSGTASVAVCDSSFSGTVFLAPAGGTSPYTYAWSNGKTDKDIVYLNPGTYSVVVKDANACEWRDTFTIASSSPAAPVLQPNEIVICAGSSTLLHTDTPLPSDYQYQWRADGQVIAGAENPELLVLGGGSYQVRLVGLGCNSAWSNAAVVNQDFAPFPPSFSVVNDVLTASAGWAAYQWYLDGQPISGAVNQILIVEKSGAYQVFATSTLGCTYPSEVKNVAISSTELPASVRQFSLTPNPTRDVLVLSFELQNAQRTIISMTDTSGQMIFNQTRQASSVTMPIDVQSLPAGTYLLTVQLEGGSSISRKVVKM